MKPTAIRLTATATAVCLLFSGCEGMTSGESAASVGAVTGIAAGLLGSAAGMDSGSAAALGAGVGLLAAGITYAVAEHQASERQRAVAEANARRAYARMSAERRVAVRKRSRYIAVRTERNQESRGKASCMVYDTERGQIVNNRVYDTPSTPQSGSTVKFASYNATYVGG